MKPILAILLLLSLGLTACVVEPGGGYRDQGWNHNDHHNDHAEQPSNGNWQH